MGSQLFPARRTGLRRPSQGLHMFKHIGALLATTGEAGRKRRPPGPQGTEWLGEPPPATVLQGTLGVAAFPSTCWRCLPGSQLSGSRRLPSWLLLPPFSARNPRGLDESPGAQKGRRRSRASAASRHPLGALRDLHRPRGGVVLAGGEETSDCPGACVARAGLPLTLPDWSAAWTLLYPSPPKPLAMIPVFTGCRAPHFSKRR